MEFGVFSHGHNFFLFELQKWLRYENDSIFHEDLQKQHRVTSKRNKRNKSNTLD